MNIWSSLSKALTGGLIFGALAAAAVLVPTLSWANSVTVEETTARVVAVGDSFTEQYQCGSNRVGEVNIPRYCTRTEWPVTYAVAGTDAVFNKDRTSSPAVGSEIVAYSIQDGDRVYYDTSSPQSPFFAILMVFLSLLAGALVGLVSYFTISHFEN